MKLLKDEIRYKNKSYNFILAKLAHDESPAQQRRNNSKQSHTRASFVIAGGQSAPGVIIARLKRWLFGVHCSPVASVAF